MKGKAKAKVRSAYVAREKVPVSPRLVIETGPISEQDLYRLRGLLSQKRKEIVERSKRLHVGMKELSEPRPELEEEAQDKQTFKAYDLLDRRADAQMREIDHALSKMDEGTYGTCEICGELIPMERLCAIPWVRLCVDDAETIERQQRGLAPFAEEEEVASEDESFDYEGMSDEQLEAEIHDHIQKDGRIDQEDLVVTVRKGLVTLKGTLPDEEEHRILLQILTDVMGLDRIKDRIAVHKAVVGDDEATSAEEGELSEDFLESIDEDQPYRV